MKKGVFKFTLLLIVTLLFTNVINQEIVDASSIVDSTVNEDIFGETISSMKIYKNGKVYVEYKYGLRKIDVYYCVKGEMCDNGGYSAKTILESDSNTPYKGSGTYEFNLNLEGDYEYRVRVEAFFGTSNAYTGTESIYGSPSISSVQIVDTEDTYLNGADKDATIKDSRIRSLLEKIKEITNFIILPVIYIVTGLYLVVKGGILGVQIVKGSDDASLRREKVGALKWLVIGVAITCAATTLVGAITGFFKNAFNL